jgi:hypothetical protein
MSWLRACVLIVLVLAGLPAAGAHAADDRGVAKEGKGTVSPLAGKIDQEIEALQAELDSLLSVVDAYAGGPVPAALQEHIATTERRLDEAIDRLDAAVAAAPAPAAAPQLPATPAPRRKPLLNTILKIGEDLRVAVDESVQGDAIVFGGDLRVDGEIQGDAIVLGGDLVVGHGAAITGQAVAVGGRIETSPGANVGETVALALLPRLQSLREGMPAWLGIVTDMLIAGFAMLVAGLLLTMAPRRFARASAYLDDSFARCLGLGLLALTGGSFAVAVALMLLALTVVGIPLAIIAFIAFGFLFFAACITGMGGCGRWLRRGRAAHTAPWISLWIGLGVIAGPWVLGDALGLVWPRLEIGLAIASFVLAGAATSAGLGALVLTRLGVASAAVPVAGEPQAEA